MTVLPSLSEAGSLRGAAVALGNFDGVHLGHQALVREAARLGRPAVVTFQPHPGKVLQPALAPKLITLLPRKLELLEAAGAEAVVVQPFTSDYARTTPGQFEAHLFDLLGASHAVVGADFTYGARRGGTVETLRRAAAARGAAVHVVPAVTVDGVVVSSSRVREYLLEGRVEAAQRLLGRAFDVDGTVVPGDGRGRQIGVPTANVDTQNELRPAAGVYAVTARFREGTGWGERRAGAANIGVKPTFGGTEVTVEVHLLDFSGDLYGRELRVEFLERLRAEQRFGSVAELVGQIRRDVEAARGAVARAGVAPRVP
jgi:riboflavin kinase/FMN adenylyltransferase